MHEKKNLIYICILIHTRKDYKMAINPVNFLKELQGYTQDNCNFDMIQAGLGYSLVGDCLDFDHWLMLTNACKNKDFQSLQTAIKEILPFYAMVYGYLDSPATAEQWHNALYGNGRNSTIKRKAIKKMYQAYKDILGKDE